MQLIDVEVPQNSLNQDPPNKEQEGILMEPDKNTQPTQPYSTNSKSNEFE